MDHPGEPAPPQYIPGTGLWLLTRYADVEAALADPAVVPLGRNGAADAPPFPGTPSFRDLLAPGRWAALHPSLEAEARRLVEQLPRGRPVDLLACLANPWSLHVAGEVLGVAPEDVQEADPLARTLFQAASSSPDGASHPEGARAAGALAALLTGPGPGETAARVQTFVALACTFPLLLAGGWRLLLEHREAVPTPVEDPQVVEEMLRLGGPAGRVFRDTTEARVWSGVPIPSGTRLALDLGAANRDPHPFPDPHRLDPRRPPGSHLALGAGAHACAGAGVIRHLLRLATGVLFRPGLELTLAGPSPPPVWREGATIRGLEALPVVVGPD